MVRNEYSTKRTTVTPDLAAQMLEHNKNNRPISDAHVERIANQIREGKWRFNGDTIKIASDESVLDGQHRLWAVVNSNHAIDTIIVRGVQPDAFATIDTIRRTRSGADVLSLMGVKVSRQAASSAMTWLLRWQRKCIPDYRKPENRIENSDIEEAWKHHRGLERAIEHVAKLRRIGNVGIFAMMFYVISNRDPFLAERMVQTMISPEGVGIDDPFFRLRAYFVTSRTKSFEPVMSIALIIKAANAAKANKMIKILRWSNQGENPEKFPELEI